MDAEALRGLLNAVAAGEVEPDEAVRRLAALPFTDLGNARVDHHRALRQGLPEAVYGPGKTPEDAALVVGELLAGGIGPVVLTRADKAQLEAALAVDATATVRGATAVWRRAAERGLDPVRITDVGVAGIHRLLAEVEVLQAADAVVVVAGMEGALTSVVGGLTGAPLVAVPTSVGYGASLEGVTALLGMLASCASGLTVVGIDNGFGAACAVMRWLGSPS
jgi:NCAIR mutase (PurE)-related protein